MEKAYQESGARSHSVDYYVSSSQMSTVFQLAYQVAAALDPDQNRSLVLGMPLQASWFDSSYCYLTFFLNFQLFDKG